MGALSGVIRRIPNQMSESVWEGWAKEQAIDDKVVHSIADKNDSNRRDSLKGWLNKYRVLRVRADSHNAICEAILRWRDEQGDSYDLSTAKNLDDSHRSLHTAIVTAYGTERSFMSLASKALWLCYPEQVPIYDGQSKIAVSLLSKIEALRFDFSKDASEYFQFCSAWLKLYDLYGADLDSIDGSRYQYRYRCRLFDIILWEVGSGGYGVKGSAGS